MPLIYVMIGVILIGCLLWWANYKAKVYPPVLTILNVVVIGALIIYLLKLFGILDAVFSIPAPRL